MIEVVKSYHESTLKVGVCTDSGYVYGGVQGGTLRWRASGWVTAQGPVTNVDLWIVLMDLLDSMRAVWEWIKVPSHVDIPGNDKADALAEQGRPSSPLYCDVRRPPVPPRTPVALPEGIGGHCMNCISHSRNVELQEICENDMATPLLMRDRLSVGSDPGNGTPLRRCLLDEMEAIILGDDTQSYSSGRRSGISTIGSPMLEQSTEWEGDRLTNDQEFSTDVSSTCKRRTYR